MRIKTLVITSHLFILLVSPFLCAADEESGVRSHGVIYNIAEDRAIVKIGGRYEPEGVDKYIKRHFDALHKKMTVLLEKMEGLEKKMDLVRDRIKRVNDRIDQLR